MIEAWEKAAMEDNLPMFKKLANHNPPKYDGSRNPKAFEDWIWGMENCSIPCSALRNGGQDLLDSTFRIRPIFGGVR